MSLSSGEREVLRALAAAALPGGALLPAGGSDTMLDRVGTGLDRLPTSVGHAFRALLWSLELGTIVSGRRRFSRMDLGERQAVLARWAEAEPRRLALRGLLTPLKLAYFDDPEVHRTLGCSYGVTPPARLESARWRERIDDAAGLSDDETIECEVVVVGTGAGGAPVAAALAERGLAVLMVEEGRYFSRTDFNGKPIDMMEKLYRRGGFTFALGNTAIGIPVGRGVGGTTLVNSGTCFRVPDATLAQWRDEYGLHDMTPEALAPYFEAVERELRVGPNPAPALGKPAELIARGCDALGWSHHALRRNAPDCDGQGLCCFGCPTDAKRSTNVSYVPRALSAGAQLVTGLRIDEILVDRHSAVGVRGRAHGGKRITVRAHAVVLACGSLHTPVLLQRNGLANGSGELGKNLSIHPASWALGEFDEPVHAWDTVPQGYAIDEFKSEGLYFEGATAPLVFAAASHPGFGPEYVALMERFEQVLQFGFMVKDRSRGTVSAGGSDLEPRIRYWIGREDRQQIQRGFGLLARVMLAAGARSVQPAIAGVAPLRSLADVERFEHASVSPRQMDITAYHPLGTARMGVDPLRSVVDSTHETWDVHHLFICDGAAVPGSLGVNPQVTIMAMALRAAEFIAARVERLSQVA